MKIDGFLKVPDIPGESKRAGHEDEMEIYGLLFDMESPHDANTRARRGRVALSPIVCVKNYDIGSVYLKQALFQNKVFDEVQITARRTIEGETSDYLVIKLEKASLVSYSFRPSEDDPDMLEERIGFVYQTVTFTYDSDHEAVMDVQVGL
jgi:type VI secretion system secreted protein Hcp